MVSSKDAIARLREAGFEIRSAGEGKGSHTKLRHPDGRVTVVPMTRDLGIGLLRAIERQTGVKLK